MAIPTHSAAPATQVAQFVDESLGELTSHLHRLPIFPLHRVYLFPGAFLPLYVFEPRYREMTATCLQQGGAMAVATLLPGFETGYEGRPPVRDIAGAGVIVAHRRHEDGTYNILLRGVARVRLEEELPPERSYREVRATLLPDQQPPEGDAELLESEQTLHFLVDQLATHIPEGGEPLRALCRTALGPGRLTDMLASSLITDPGKLLQLLETPDVAARVELVTAEVARHLAQFSHRGTGAN